MHFLIGYQNSLSGFPQLLFSNLQPSNSLFSFFFPPARPFFPSFFPPFKLFHFPPLFLLISTFPTSPIIFLWLLSPLLPTFPQQLFSTTFPPLFLCLIHHLFLSSPISIQTYNLFCCKSFQKQRFWTNALCTEAPSTGLVFSTMFY